MEPLSTAAQNLDQDVLAYKDDRKYETDERNDEVLILVLPYTYLFIDAARPFLSTLKRWQDGDTGV
jgi:hypothetical protein